MNTVFQYGWVAGLSALLSVSVGCASQADIDAWQARHQPLQSTARDSGHPPPEREASPAFRPRTHPDIDRLDNALALPDEDFDLALALLLFAREYGGGQTDVKHWLAVIDGWTTDLAARIDGIRATEHRLAVMRRFIHERLGFVFDSRDPEGYLLDNLLFDRVLQRRRGYCVTLSLVYLVLARGVGIELRGARLPGHFAVMVGDDTGVFESTAEGRPRARRELFTAYYLSLASVDHNGVYLTPITDKEIFSTLYNNLGGLASLAGRDDDARHALDRAVALSPKNIEARFNRAGVLSRGDNTEDIQTAMQDVNEAIRLDPNFYAGYCRRAGLYHRHGDKERAERDLKRAFAIRLDLPMAYVEEGVMAYRDKNIERARAAFGKALEKDADNLDALRNLSHIERSQGNTRLADELWTRYRQAAPDGS